MFKAAVRFLGIYVLLSVFLGALLLLQVFPYRPSTTWGWVAFFGLALPATALGEVVSLPLMNNRIANVVENRTRGRTFSWPRVAYAFTASLVLFAIGLMIYFVWRRFTA